MERESVLSAPAQYCEEAWRLSIKIWDRNSNEVIYDNMRGWPDDAEPPAIGGGSTMIH